MKIGVVIPLYNKVAHIQRALDSVFGQTHQDIEIVVVDDGSTDGGGALVRQIADPRLKLITQKNGGVSSARNNGIKALDTPLVAFLDADDYWMPGHLEAIARLAEKYPQCGAYGAAWAWEKGGKLHHPHFSDVPPSPWEGVVRDYFESSSKGDLLLTSSSIVCRRCVFDVVGLFPEGVRMGEDQDMWLRIALRYPVAFSTVVGAVYRLQAENRASVHYRLEDINSPIFESWNKYINDRDSESIRAYINITQYALMRSMCRYGYGRLARKSIPKSVISPTQKTVILIFSIFGQRLFDLLAIAKNQVLVRN